MSRARAWPGLSDIDRSVDIALTTGYHDWLFHNQWIREMSEGGLKDSLAEQMALGDAALLAENIDRAKLHYERVNQAHYRHTVLLPLARTGQKVRRPYGDANRKKTADSNASYEDWQRRANEKWAEPQHAEKGARRIAELIAIDGENPDTIRRKIRKMS